MFFIDSVNSYENFCALSKYKYFVDKSNIINDFNKLIETEKRFVCITRPRRFGKTSITNMVSSYYSKAFDAKKIFDNLKVSKGKSIDLKERQIEIDQYNENQGKYHTIFIDFSFNVTRFEKLNDYLNWLNLRFKKDLIELYPDSRVLLNYSNDLYENIEELYNEKKEKFVFIMDEWDYIYNKKLFSLKEREDYGIFLKYLLKGKSYVAFAFMTGILPIAKDSSQSSLNCFSEFDITNDNIYNKYFGFTCEEVKILCAKNKFLSYNDLKHWYNGYKDLNGDSIFNPWSVTEALSRNHIDGYWTKTGPVNEIMNLIINNIDDIKEDIIRLIDNESIKLNLTRINVSNFELETRNEILSVMTTLGLLTYYNGEVSIPNKELMLIFEDVLKKKEMGNVKELLIRSENMLNATLAKDTKTMSKILEYTHNLEIPIFKYNDENSLSCVISMVYLNARNQYKINREDKNEKGYVDFIFYPYQKQNGIIIIMEFKKGKTPEEAINQIYQKKYYLGIREKGYQGKILLVGINYNKNKNHECVIEDLDKSKILKLENKKI